MKSLFLFLVLFIAPAEASFQLVDEKGGNFIYDKDSKALASSVHVVFRTGHMHDPAGLEGITKISFQALARGTKNKSRDEFVKELELLGGVLEFDTASNRTILTLNVLSENLEPAIQLLAEALLSPALDKKEVAALIEEEKAKLIQEKTNNRALLKRAFRQALFSQTPLAFPAEGTLSSVSQLNPENMRAHLAQHIRQGNILIATSTNQAEEKVRPLLEKAFAKLPEGQAPSIAMPKLNSPKGLNLYLVPRKGSSTTEMAIGQLGVSADDPEKETLELGNFIFGGDYTSRLMTELRKKNGWTYGAASGYQIFELPRRHGGAFLIYGFPQGEHTSKALLKSLELFRTYVKNGLNNKEIAYAKNSLVNSYPFRLANSKGRVMAKLYETLDGAKAYSTPEYRKVMNKVSAKSLKQALKKHDPNSLIIVLVGDPAHLAEATKALPEIKDVKTISDPMEKF